MGDPLKPTGGAHLNLSVGALVAVGGMMGYVKKKSVPSFVAGVGLGGVLIASGLLVNTGNEYRGYTVGAGAGVAMAAGMGARFMSTRKFMPAGAVALLGTVTTAYNVAKALEWQD